MACRNPASASGNQRFRERRDATGELTQRVRAVSFRDLRPVSQRSFQLGGQKFRPFGRNQSRRIVTGDLGHSPDRAGDERRSAG
ncbi:MAG TPA: hypothetical protein PLV92_22105, partial [Pirellulaceae bacterium]|nr:hypothetical protein [Pirellulaceae bacterium]